MTIQTTRTGQKTNCFCVEAPFEGMIVRMYQNLLAANMGLILNNEATDIVRSLLWW